MDEIYCPICGEEMEQWHGDIFECIDCGIMIDIEIFKDTEGDNFYE